MGKSVHEAVPLRGAGEMVYESIVSDCISVTQSNFCPQTGLAEQTRILFSLGPQTGRQAGRKTTALL